MRRLKGPAEYQRVFDAATRARDGLFVVLGRRNDEGAPRLGLAISMKAAGTAVARNRAKRAAREAFRAAQEQLGGADIIVIARPAIRKAAMGPMRNSLENLIRSVGKQCAQS